MTRSSLDRPPEFCLSLGAILELAFLSHGWAAAGRPMFPGAGHRRGRPGRSRGIELIYL